MFPSPTSRSPVTIDINDRFNREPVLFDAVLALNLPITPPERPIRRIPSLRVRFGRSTLTLVVSPGQEG